MKHTIRGDWPSRQHFYDSVTLISQTITFPNPSELCVKTGYKLSSLRFSDLYQHSNKSIHTK